MSARSACLGLSRWRESCLPLLLDIRRSRVSLDVHGATLGLSLNAVCDCFMHEICAARISLLAPIIRLQNKPNEPSDVFDFLEPPPQLSDMKINSFPV